MLFFLRLDYMVLSAIVHKVPDTFHRDVSHIAEALQEFTQLEWVPSECYLNFYSTNVHAINVLLFFINLMRLSLIRRNSIFAVWLYNVFALIPNQHKPNHVHANDALTQALENIKRYIEQEHQSLQEYDQQQWFISIW